jgi:hypothetical protein
MITNEETNAETGQGGEVMAKEHQMQLEQDHPEGRNKPARKSDEITTTPARTQRTTTAIPTTGEGEQSALEKTHSARKKDLLAFFGEGARVLPPSMEGTPVDTAKANRSPGSGATDIIKKRDNLDSDNGIGRKKSKSDDKESHEGVIDLEQMEKMPLKVKGTKSSARKGKARIDKEKNTPNSGKKKATFAETVGKEEVKEKEIKYKTCVVGFAVCVNKTKDTKGGFDKKLLEVGGPALKLAKKKFAPNAIFKVGSCLYILYDLTSSILLKNSTHSCSYEAYRRFVVFFTSD